MKIRLYCPCAGMILIDSSYFYSAGTSGSLSVESKLTPWHMLRHSAKDLTVSFLSSVLKLSIFLEISDGEEYATAQLPKLTDFTPALQMSLGRQYRIDRWIEPAFRQLVTLPIIQFQFTDAQLIGFSFFHILVKTKAEIDQHRRTIAFSAPDAVLDPLCSTGAVCNEYWIKEWWNGLAKQLLHPDAALTESEIMAGFDTVLIPGMCDLCQRRSIEWVKAKKVFEREGFFIDEAVKEVMELQTDEPIRAAMRHFAQ
jgi:hypothetical protein